MKTETKIIISILGLTAIIIFGGITLFKNNINNNINGAKDYSKYIKSNLVLDKTKISRDYNPKITGIDKNETNNTLSLSPNTLSTSTKATSSTIYVTEFLDYECPACATNGEMITKQLLDIYGSNIIITRKIFPVHGQTSIDIASIVLASQILGNKAYQDIHAKVFETFSQWSILPKKDREDFIKKIITDLGYDYELIANESKKDRYVKQIMTDKQDSIDLGISATPSFIINNNTIITGGIPTTEIQKIIDNR